MPCPFCVEEILNEALVCRHCGNDVRIPDALKTENAELKQQVIDLKAELEELLAAQAKRKPGDKASLQPASDE